jgi:hypothetical protein
MSCATNGQVLSDVLIDKGWTISSPCYLRAMLTQVIDEKAGNGDISGHTKRKRRVQDVLEKYERWKSAEGVIDPLLTLDGHGIPPMYRKQTWRDELVKKESAILEKLEALQIRRNGYKKDNLIR